MKDHRKPIFKGCATALATPFRDGEVDYFTLGEMIERQIRAGVSALVICGTTGEASTLTIYEHLKCIDFAVRLVDGRIPVIAGSGSNCTKKAMHISKNAAEVGADALLVVTPYYNKASDDGLIAHYESIADISGAPIILYNVPSRTGCNIPLSVYKRLSEHKNIVAVKEASGNLSVIAQLIAECGDKLDIYSGNDDQILPILSLGGLGVISVAVNVLYTVNLPGMGRLTLALPSSITAVNSTPSAWSAASLAYRSPKEAEVRITGQLALASIRDA